MAPKTIKQALEDMLEDLKPEDFKKFCAQLVDRRKEPRVRRNRVEGKDFLDVADVLVSTFTEQGALAVADEVPHNNIPGAVYGVDGELVPIESITNYLNDQHCPSLQGKPKLFFIQACGGGKKDIGFEVSPNGVEPSTSGADDQMDNIPMSSSSDSSSMSTLSDILVSYSTFPGYVSWRVPQSGSYYVETLDRILEEKAATVDLLGMLTMVCNEVCKKSANRIYKQISGSFESLCKSLYFQTKE
eukprot:superscaffoldBa00005495_g20419